MTIKSTVPESPPAVEAGKVMLTGQTKGMPGHLQPIPLSMIAAQNWNVLREDLPLPLAIIKRHALEHNSRWMREFVAAHDGLFAPHGKTTMSPELFARQLADGAWGMTLATAHQVQVARSLGINRIVLANQLIGKQAIDYVLQEIKADADFDFYCIADAVGPVTALAHAAKAAKLSRPVQVLVEVGLVGGRSGCRDLESALAVAQAVHAHSPWLSLRGVEGFEGVATASDQAGKDAVVINFLEMMAHVARQCDQKQYFANDTILLSAGGSAYFDLVFQTLSTVSLTQSVKVLTRSGCYLTHDCNLYAQAFDRIKHRHADQVCMHHGLLPALEVWAYVHSCPEPGCAIVGMGKRDISYDDMPLAQQWHRPSNAMSRPQVLEHHTVTRLNDQHCYLATPADSPLLPGDMVQFGISHPCLTFDKWRILCVVDEDYRVVDGVSTLF